LGFAVRERADVVVQFEELPIPAEFIGKNYDQDGEYWRFRAGSTAVGRQGCAAGAVAPNTQTATDQKCGRACPDCTVSVTAW
jgi:hypothetical protein